MKIVEIENNHALNALQAYASMNDLEINDNQVITDNDEASNIKIKVSGFILTAFYENVSLYIPLQNNAINTANSINRYIDMLIKCNDDYINTEEFVPQYISSNKDITFSAGSNDVNCLEISLHYRAEEREWANLIFDPKTHKINVEYQEDILLRGCGSFKDAAKSVMEYIAMNYEDDGNGNDDEAF
jgi:hypothetical protein